MPVLIGLCGKAGHGKDACANVMAQRLGSVSRSFADPIKRACSEIWGVPLSSFHDREKKDAPIAGRDLTPREMAILLGTDLFRARVDPDFWVKRLKYELEFMVTDPSTPFICVTDVRFPNEALMIKELGGVIIHVDASQRVSPPGGAVSTHSTEAGIPSDMIDAEIDNNSDLETLESNVLAAIGELVV